MKERGKGERGGEQGREREETGTTTEGIWALKILNLLLQGNRGQSLVWKRNRIKVDSD